MEEKMKQNEKHPEERKVSPEEKKAYGAYIKEITPVNNLWKDMLGAFLVGGAICVLGQIFMNQFLEAGIEKDAAASWTSIVLVGLAILATGWNLFPKLVKFGGAGALVPITGFANGVAAPAIEYRAEGQIFGIGCKIFTIAGPVIFYGICSSWVLGLIYWVLQLVGVV